MDWKYLAAVAFIPVLGYAYWQTVNTVRKSVASCPESSTRTRDCPFEDEVAITAQRSDSLLLAILLPALSLLFVGYCIQCASPALASFGFNDPGLQLWLTSAIDVFSVGVVPFLAFPIHESLVKCCILDQRLPASVKLFCNMSSKRVRLAFVVVFALLSIAFLNVAQGYVDQMTGQAKVSAFQVLVPQPAIAQKYGLQRRGRSKGSMDLTSAKMIRWSFNGHVFDHSSPLVNGLFQTTIMALVASVPWYLPGVRSLAPKNKALRSFVSVAPLLIERALANKISAVMRIGHMINMTMPILRLCNLLLGTVGFIASVTGLVWTIQSIVTPFLRKRRGVKTNEVLLLVLPATALVLPLLLTCRLTFNFMGRSYWRLLYGNAAKSAARCVAGSICATRVASLSSLPIVFMSNAHAVVFKPGAGKGFWSFESKGKME